MAKSNEVAPYGVSIASADATIKVYSAQTIDEACGMALGFFRTSNVSGCRVYVNHMDTILVTFEK